MDWYGVEKPSDHPLHLPYQLPVQNTRHWPITCTSHFHVIFSRLHDSALLAISPEDAGTLTLSSTISHPRVAFIFSIPSISICSQHRATHLLIAKSSFFQYLFQRLSDTFRHSPNPRPGSISILGHQSKWQIISRPSSAPNKTRQVSLTNPLPDHQTNICPRSIAPSTTRSAPVATAIAARENMSSPATVKPSSSPTSTRILPTTPRTR